MPRLSFRVSLLLFTALNAGSASAFASESDPYTYADVPLEDLAPRINAEVNADLREVIGLSNAILSRGDARAFGDTEVELLVARVYDAFVLPNREKLVLHRLEECVNRGECGQRIHLLPGESVYARSRYSRVTRVFVTDTLNLCGVRLGSDKITHLLNDGFLLYNVSMDRADPFSSDEGLEKLNQLTEWTINGPVSTGVVSHADMAANRAGRRLFLSLFDAREGLIQRSRATGLLSPRRPVDLCAFVDGSLDERINPNEYPGRRRKRLEKAIADTLAQTNASTEPWSQEQLDALFARKSTFDVMSSLSIKIHVGLRMARMLFTTEPMYVDAVARMYLPRFRLRHRKETFLPSTEEAAEWTAPDPERVLGRKRFRSISRALARHR